MKKIMIAACVVALTAISQAATVEWGVTGVQKNGDGVDGIAYVFCTKGNKATSIDAVTAALAGYAGDASAMQTYLSNNSLSALNSSVSDGKASVTGVDLASSGVPESTSSVKLFAVVFDTDSVTADSNYYITTASGNVKTPAAGTSNKASFTIANQATASGGEGAWTSVTPTPEPTSGLLLLIGIGAMALRRRRA